MNGERIGMASIHLDWRRITVGVLGSADPSTAAAIVREVVGQWPGVPVDDYSAGILRRASERAEAQLRAGGYGPNAAKKLVDEWLERLAGEVEDARAYGYRDLLEYIDGH